MTLTGVFVLVWHPVSFLIAHAPKGLCLSRLSRDTIVYLGVCDSTNPAQQWRWTDDMKLYHKNSSMCLWADTSVKKFEARLVELNDCGRAPAWKCYDEWGVFGLVNKPLYLKKQGIRLVIQRNSAYSNWTIPKMNSAGKLIMTPLCQKEGE